MICELFKLKIDGQTYYATYRLWDGQVHVTSPFGSKSAPKGKQWPLDVAERLLREVLTANTADKQAA